MIKRSNNMRFRVLVGLAFFLFAGQLAWAQATLTTSAQSTALTSQGHSELVGKVEVRVRSGQTLAGPLVVRYSPFQITNNFGRGITVIGTGAFSTIGTTLDLTQNSITLNIPAGGTLGDGVTIQGVRVSAVDSTAKVATATFSSSNGNTIDPNEQTRTVVFDVLPGLVDVPASDRTVAAVDGIITDSSALVYVREGFIGPLGGSVGTFGQTVRSQVAVIPYPSIPEGAVLNFPSQVNADNTSAVLRTLSGGPEVLRKSSPQQFMVYEFIPDEVTTDGSPASAFAIETFAINILLSQESAFNGSIHFWVALYPFGAAVPNAMLPSTAIPRYKKVVIPTDTDEDGLADDVDPDADNDGLTNDEEKTLGTDPLKKDTDGDKLTDFEEVRGTRGFKTDPLKADTDGGGINDFEEIELGTDPTKAEFNLYFPFSVSSTGLYTGITVCNPLNKEFTVDLTAYDPSGRVITGAGITNPVKVVLPPLGQSAKLATEMFGSGFVSASFGSVAARCSTDLLAGFFMAGDTAGSRLDGATASFLTYKSFVLPAIARGKPDSFTDVEIFNPADSTATVKLTLVNRNGAATASKTFSLNAKASITGNIANLFNLTLNPQNIGYIGGISDVGVVAFELFGDGSRFNGLNGQEVIDGRSELLVPFYVSGAGWATELELANLDASNAVVITLRLLDRDGASVPGVSNPQTVRILPGAHYKAALDVLFGLSTSTMSTGQLHLKIAGDNPFVRIPAIAGNLRFETTDGALSAALPISSTQGTDVIYSYVVHGGGFYTGIAIANQNSTAATITLEVYSPNGQLTGLTTFTLNAGQSTSRLLNELIPSIVEQRGGWFRVKSDKAVLSFALFGSTDGRFLSVIGPQKAK